MSRHSSKIRPIIKKTEGSQIIFSNQSMLRSYQIWQFFQYHKEPKRPPIVNKIRKEIYQNGIDYDFIRDKYRLEEERILASLSYKYEPCVTNALVDYFNLSPVTSYDDYISNYDFEQKDICHKSGGITPQKREAFVIEFEKSWSKETTDKYKKQMEELIWEQEKYDYAYEEQIDKMLDAEKKEVFVKLLRIYDEYPDIVRSFCNSFTENTTE